MVEPNDNASIEVLQRGIKFLVYTSNRVKRDPVEFNFCHKNMDGKFVDGLTTEGVILMLISRQHHLTDKESSTENVQVLLFLKQALEALSKRKRNKLNSRNEYKRNDVRLPPTGE